MEGVPEGPFAAKPCWTPDR
jgi:plasmid stabilization system protein ParE/Arc/MetJ-type ribon-helix-helix transcriptional regulator